MNNSSEFFWRKGLEYVKHDVNLSSLVGLRKFKEFFGVSPQVCSIAWGYIENQDPSIKSKHLLWTLFFLKRYNTEHVNASVVNADEKTFRLYSWKVIEALANIDLVVIFVYYNAYVLNAILI